jgi:DNA-binding NarL/FixJ family response regulator
MSALMRTNTMEDQQLNPESFKGMVLCENVIIGYQVSHLLSSRCGWQMYVAHNDEDVYWNLAKGRLNAVIADIDSSNLRGLAVLVYIKRYWPSVITYAITSDDDPYIKHLATNMAGCEGFFYLLKDKMMIDSHLGMAAELQALRNKH